MGELWLLGLTRAHILLDAGPEACADGGMRRMTSWGWVRRVLRACALLGFGVGAWLSAAAAPAGATNLLDRALMAWKSGDHTNALVLVDQAVAATPKDIRTLNFRAQIRALMGRRAEAIADLDAAIAVEPQSAWLHHERGEHQFRAGNFDAACADFARADALAPQRAAQDWQLGIALYYAGRFAEGRKLFELHRTVNPEDVENAAWHYLCVARMDGVEKARAVLIPVRGDTRVPMKEVQKLFAGTARPEDVLQAAEQGPEAERPGQRFYAHLYIGLHHEAAGQADLAAVAIRRAAALARHAGYMGEVARVHAQVLDAARPAARPAAQ